VNGYDAASSGGSNLGPTSRKLADLIKDRVGTYRATNGLAADQAVPADAVTASGSGLDPHISPANAALQAARVAASQGAARPTRPTLTGNRTCSITTFLRSNAEFCPRFAARQ
jgi:K+-transporting ATPase c subunit